MKIVKHWYPLRAAIVCLGLLGAAGCTNAATADIKTEAAADETVKFSGFKSYGWFGGLGVVRDTTGKWSNNDLDIAGELKFLIDQELRGRGYEAAESNPDFLVGFLVAANIDELKKVEERGGKVSHVEGAGNSGLIIEIIDAKTERTIWVGVALGDAKTDRPKEEVKERMAFAVSELLKKLPD